MQRCIVQHIYHIIYCGRIISKFIYMPRAFYPIDDVVEKADNYFIITAEYELVFDTIKLENELERLEEKRERIKVRANEDLERVNNKISSLKKCLEKNKI